jgi:hypothetical protein
MCDKGFTIEDHSHGQNANATVEMHVSLLWGDVRFCPGDGDLVWARVQATRFASGPLHWSHSEQWLLQCQFQSPERADRRPENHPHLLSLVSPRSCPRSRAPRRPPPQGSSVFTANCGYVVTVWPAVIASAEENA